LAPSNLLNSYQFKIKMAEAEKSAADSISKLEADFKNFDLEGEGKVDFISFTTALQQTTIPKEQYNKAWEEIEKDDEGNIFYSEFIAWCRQNMLEAGENLGLGEVAQTDFTDAEKEEIKRAVVVIQKATLKKMSREEVYSFLTSKGVSKAIIDHAYLEVQATMNPQQRIQYYKKLSEENAREASEMSYENKKLKKELAKKNKELVSLRATLSKSVEMVMASYQQTSKSFCPQEVLDEVREASENDGGAKSKQLQQLHDLLTARRFVVAWLLFQTFGSTTELSNTQLFLEDFNPTS